MTREELIAALEKARDRSRHLDERIALAAGWHLQDWAWWPPEVVELARALGKSLSECGKSRGGDPPRFTSSTEAAMTLFPIDWPMRLIITWRGGKVWVTEYHNGEDRHEFTHSVLPIAICIAALKAGVV